MTSLVDFSSGHANIPKIFLNRHLAAEHLVDPSNDPEAKHAIFNQVNSLFPQRIHFMLVFFLKSVCFPTPILLTDAINNFWRQIAADLEYLKGLFIGLIVEKLKS